MLSSGPRLLGSLVLLVNLVGLVALVNLVGLVALVNLVGLVLLMCGIVSDCVGKG